MVFGAIVGGLSAFGTALKSTLDVFGLFKKPAPPPQQPPQNVGVPGGKLQPIVLSNPRGPSNRSTTMNQTNNQSSSISANLNSSNDNVNSHNVEANNQNAINNKEEGSTSSLIIGLVAVLAILAIFGFVAFKVNQKVVSGRRSRRKASSPTSSSSSASSSKTSTTRTGTKKQRK
uniref:Wsv008 n=1 Tax=Strongyloides papillosus TaxID=174720 RepID=A0A0N5C7V7_STREA